MQRIEEKELWFKFLAGEEKAYDKLFRTYFAGLVLYARSIIKEDAIAKDIAQDSFIKLWKHRAAINKGEAAKSYLYTVVRNACIDYINKQARWTTSVKNWQPQDQQIENGYDEQIVHAETMRIIFQAAENLPPVMREVFRLYYVEGKTYKEISELYGTKEDTIRKQRRRAIEILRKEVGLTITLSVVLSRIF